MRRGLICATGTSRTGDVIYGSIVNTGGQSWTVAAQDISNFSLPVATLKTNGYNQTFDWVFAAALETYGITACNQLPATGPAQFTDIQAFVTGTVVTNPHWTIANGSISCTSATVVSSTDVNINY
jgi:hypothetical protein